MTESTDAVPALQAYSAGAGLPFDLDAFESRVVWIWGSPRSGSTWLLRQLSYPLFPFPEATTIFRIPGPGHPWKRDFDVLPVDESFIPNHLAPALADPQEIGGTYVPGTINNYLGKRPSYLFSDAYREVWAPEARRFALVRLYAFLARARAESVPMADDPLVVIKEGNGTHAADFVMRLMPRSRLLFLVRDGRDVVDSLLHAYQPGGFLARQQGVSFDGTTERLEGLRWGATMWSCNVDAVTSAIAAHADELTHIVRYEDLRSDTSAEIDDLHRWLGLERSTEERDRMLAATAFERVPVQRKGALERNRSAQPGLWRQNLTDEEQRLCVEIMGPRLERLGYEID